MNGTIAPGAKLAVLGQMEVRNHFVQHASHKRAWHALSKSCKIGYFEQTLSILKQIKPF